MSDGICTMGRPLRGRACGALLFLIVSVWACASGGARPSDPREVVFAESLGVDLNAMTRTRRGVYTLDLRPGDGDEVRRGSRVRVLYKGSLPDGAVFDASRDESDVIEFRIGESKVIEGWEEGLMGMKAGGLRRLVVPPALGYGRKRVENVPANATLVFDILLVDVR